VSDPSPDHDHDHAHAHAATFSLACSPDHAERLRTALEPEVDEIAADRSRARLDDDADTEDGVTIAVDTRDLSAMRAATGTWLGLLEAADRTVVGATREREP
jgi:tRNA threonylcarbamoyladenosine modification (KEOPS) complex  Pcc1 subunit